MYKFICSNKKFPNPQTLFTAVNNHSEILHISAKAAVYTHALQFEPIATITSPTQQ